MTGFLRTGFGLLKASAREFVDDECPRMAAALSYYTVFSLPAILVLLLLILGAVLDPEQVQGSLQAQMRGLLGASGAEQVETILRQAQRPDVGRPLAALLGLAGLLFGATGAFVELQGALNRAWGVQPDPDAGGVRSFLLKRLFSFGMVLVLAFLLLVSLAVSAVLAAFGDALAGFLPGLVSGALLQALNQAISLAAIALLFAAMFKILPDAVIAWRDVWVGALATALLFVLGKFLIGVYLGNASPGEAFGAAGSLAVLLVWVYYSSMIVLFGAEFTQVWARERGSGVQPEPGAVQVERRAVEVEPGAPPTRE